MTLIVVDTNVLISAAIKADGIEAKVLALCADRTCESAVSDALEAEYRAVGARKKFARHADALAILTDRLVRTSLRVAVDHVAQRCADPDDDMVLACAVAAQAGYLVTGNTSDFPREVGTLRVLNGRSLLAALGVVGRGDGA